MEKCHPLQEGPARPERCASLSLDPQRALALGPAPELLSEPPPSAGRGSGSVPAPRPPRLRLRGSWDAGPGIPGWFLSSLRTGPGRPLGGPGPDPAGLPAPTTLLGGHGRGGGGPPAQPGRRVASWEQGRRAQIPRMDAQTARGMRSCWSASAAAEGAGARPDAAGGAWTRRDLRGWDGSVRAPRSGLALFALPGALHHPSWGPSSPFPGVSPSSPVIHHKAAQPLPSPRAEKGEPPGKRRRFLGSAAAGSTPRGWISSSSVFFPNHGLGEEEG